MDSLKFVQPPTDKKIGKPYATYSDGFGLKLYRTLGAAKQGLSHQIGTSWGSVGAYRDGYILEQVDGQWFILYFVAKGTTKHNLPWKKDVPQYWGGGTTRKSVPMTREEYAEWRVKVDRELRSEAINATPDNYPKGGIAYGGVGR